MNDASVESARFEPTVFGAVRRYRIMVLVFTLVAMAAAVGYTRYAGKAYQAKAAVTVPVPQSPQGQDPEQYLDSQVLLLQSAAVAQRAASIAASELHSNILSVNDFTTSGGEVTIAPPAGAAAGVYGASIIGVVFTASNPTVAQTGANALLQAFADVRSATISSQFNNAIAGIDNLIGSTTSSTQRSALLAQQNQLLVNEQLDLAQTPTVVFAVKPTKLASGGLKQAAAIGLVIGFLLGAALAYVRASRRQGFVDRQDPAALYGVPLIGEIPAFEMKALRSNGSAAVGLPMSADPHSAAAEAFRFAAGSVERIRADRGPRLSLVFVSPLADAGKSMVVANLALALAEGGTRVLVVDADTGGDLTARLLPGTPADGGLEQVLAGKQPLGTCIQPSPLSAAVAVLGSGPALQRRVTGAARSKAASALLDTAKSSFDVVLIDSPGLLQVADAAELIGASDAVVIVLGPNELIRDHVETVDRLKLIRSDVVGYIYNRVPTPAHVARNQGNGSSARPINLDSSAEDFPTLILQQPPDGRSGPSTELRRE